MIDLLAGLSAVGVFMIVGAITVEPPGIPDWLQYGAFGLCCVMVMFLLWYVRDMGRIIREKDKNYIELLEKDIASRNRLSEALEDKKCLAGDQRIRV